MKPKLYILRFAIFLMIILTGAASADVVQGTVLKDHSGANLSHGESNGL
jgi:hypothetical protein